MSPSDDHGSPEWSPVRDLDFPPAERGPNPGTAVGTGPAASYAVRVPESRRGLLFGVAAYVMWGAFPLYWPLLEPAGAFEILAHRILWSCITMGVLVVAVQRTSQLRAV